MASTRSSIQSYIFTMKKAQELMEYHGLADEGWLFEISNTKTFVGQCYHHTKTIKFSKYFLDEPDEQIVDTILHEIAHALVGPNHGHDYEWKRMARKLGAEPNRVAENAIGSAKHNFLIRCENPNCRHKPQWKRHRLKRNAWANAYCPSCGSPLKAYSIEYNN